LSIVLTVLSVQTANRLIKEMRSPAKSSSFEVRKLTEILLYKPICTKPPIFKSELLSRPYKKFCSFLNETISTKKEEEFEFYDFSFEESCREKLCQSISFNEEEFEFYDFSFEESYREELFQSINNMSEKIPD